MKKIDLLEETLGLFAQEMALKYAGTSKPDDVFSKVASMVKEIRNGLAKTSDNHTSELNSRNDTGSSSISSARGGRDAKDQEGELKSNEPAEDAKRSEEERVVIRSKPLNITNLRLFFPKTSAELKSINTVLSEISEKFVDFKNHKGYFFAELPGRRMFEMSNLENLEQYVIINCFATYLVSSQMGENRTSMNNLVGWLKELQPAAAKQNIPFSSFMNRLNEIVTIVLSGNVEVGLELFIESCAQVPAFLTTLVWCIKFLIKKFLNSLKQEKKNSYLQKYYIIDCLLFGEGTIKEEDYSLYKMMRYCVELFFIVVEGFCELIYIRKANEEYHYKNILINKPKDLQRRKPVLLYLLVIQEKYSLFSSFELPDSVPVSKQAQLKESIPQQKTMDAAISVKSIDNSIPDEGVITNVGLSSPSIVNREMSPQHKGENQHHPLEISLKPIENQPDFTKSELTPAKQQSHLRSIYSTDQCESANNLVHIKSRFSEQTGINSIYRHQPLLQSERVPSLSPPKEQLKSKLTALRPVSDSISFFDREAAVLGLMTCLEEMDTNFIRLSAQRVNPPKNEIFSRGRSYCRDGSQNHTKITRVTGKSQDVAFNQRYNSGARFNLFSGGLQNGFASNLSLKQDRNNIQGRDQLYRGLEYKYTNTMGGPPGPSYRYANYTDSALAGNLRRVATGDQPAYLIN